MKRRAFAKNMLAGLPAMVVLPGAAGIITGPDILVEESKGWAGYDIPHQRGPFTWPEMRASIQEGIAPDNLFWKSMPGFQPGDIVKAHLPNRVTEYYRLFLTFAVLYKTTYPTLNYELEHHDTYMYHKSRHHMPHIIHAEYIPIYEGIPLFPSDWDRAEGLEHQEITYGIVEGQYVMDNVDEEYLKDEFLS